MSAIQEISKPGARGPERIGGLVELVDRREETERLRSALQDVLDGAGRLILVAGEPGCGKTRLAEELSRTARERGANVAWGRCWEEEGTPPLWPWIQVIRTCLRAVDPTVLRELVGPHGTELTNLVSTFQAGESETTAEPGSPAARFRLFNAITYLLDSYSRRAPLVLILDDLDRADPASLVLLQFLTQEQRQRPILMIGVYREPVSPANRALTQAIVEAMREPGTERMTIGGLCHTDTRELLSALLDTEPAERIVADLHLRSGGIPLYLTECARHLRAGGGGSSLPASAGDLPIPVEIREVIERRLAPLSEEERAILRVAAGLGREVHTEALLCALEEHGLTDRAAASLRAAESLGLLRRGAAEGVHLFAQGMVHELLREELAAARTRARRALSAPGPAESGDTSGTPAEQERTTAVFRHEGEYWTMTFAGHTVRVREAKGFHHVALLLRHPGEPLHVTEIVQVGTHGAVPREARSATSDDALAVSRDLGDAGAILDARARQEYRRRLAELRMELEQAQEFHDRGRVERARQEIEFLTQELAGAIGLGGRDRRAGSSSERARVNVARSIARAIEKIAESHPDLARHLGTHIKTGTFCAYNPDPVVATTWIL